ncbi:MAG TPA: XdhC family protein [Aestuariivirgaceae bacterium]|jgi:xanthine dehydrogenase accessory factor|nr:XdhC family protein [Aestuariivirgaceae bacterium]
MRYALLMDLIKGRNERRRIAMVTNLANGAERLVDYDRAKDDLLADDLEQAFRFDRSGIVKIGDAEYFINVYNPPLHLVIVGAVHLAQALIPLARAAGYDVTVIDPRAAFASPERFPDVVVHDEWPDEVLPKLDLGPRTALVALTHDPKIDDPALNAALHSGCFYIGALGSKKTQGARRERLAAAGFKEADLSRIHGPIGLSIGARGPAEIAISIMAEVTAALRVGKADEVR